MDPKSLCNQKLCQWAEDMGYLRPNGTVATQLDFAVATSTRCRRKLWDQITSYLKDRRIVRHIKKNETDQKADINQAQIVKLKAIRSSSEKQEYDIKQAEQKIIQRIEKIRSIEENGKELQIKTLLFNTIKHRNIEESEVIHSKINCIHSLTRSLDVKPAAANFFLETHLTEMRSRWFDPALMDHIRDLLIKSNMLGEGLWQTLIARIEGVTDACNVQKQEAALKLTGLRHKIGPSPHNWIDYVAAQRLHTVSRNAMVVLLRGAGVNKMAGRTDSVVDQVSPTPSTLLFYHEPCKNGFYEKGCNDGGMLDEFRIKCSEIKKTYEISKVSTNAILSEHKTIMEKSLKSGRRFKKILAGLNGKRQCGAAEWRSLLQNRTILIQKHNAIIWQYPLSQLRTMTLSRLRPSVSESGCETIAFKFEEDINNSEEIELLLKKLENCDGLRKNSGRLRRLILSLEKIQDRTQKLSEVNEKMKRIIRIYRDQPFGKMIPDAYTVDDLTFKEWQLGLNLISKPLRK